MSQCHLYACPDCGKTMQQRFARFGGWLQCADCGRKVQMRGGKPAILLFDKLPGVRAKVERETVAALARRRDGIDLIERIPAPRPAGLANRKT